MALLTCCGAWLLCSGASAADWPRWRGPNGNDISPETSGWPDGWPPRRLWTANVGRGCTSPIAAAGRLYVMGWQGTPRGNPMGKDVLYCLDARTGKELWQQSYECRYQGRLRRGDENQYGGPSSTPTFDAATGHIFTLSVDGHLRCRDTRAEGRLVWAENLYDEYDIPQRPDVGGGVRDFGFTTAPLLLGDALIVEVGARDGLVMAFDKADGRRLWASDARGPAGHTGGPVRIEVGGQDAICILALREVVLMRAGPQRSGETIARFPWATHYGCNIATPAPGAGGLLLTSGYNHRKTCLITAGAPQPGVKWTSRDHALVTSPVVHKGRAFVLGNQLSSLDVATGQRLWRGGRFGHGSCLVTAGDDKLIVFGNGRLTLVEALPADSKYRELSRVDGVVGGTCYPHVALSDGLIFCKDKNGSMACFAVR